MDADLIELVLLQLVEQKHALVAAVGQKHVQVEDAADIIHVGIINYEYDV